MGKRAEGKGTPVMGSQALVGCRPPWGTDHEWLSLVFVLESTLGTEFFCFNFTMEKGTLPCW